MSTIKTVTYQKLFPLGMYINEKIGVELNVEHGEDYYQVLNLAKIMVEDFHRKSNPSLYPNGNEALASSFDSIPEPQIQRPKDTVEAIIQDIGNVTDMKVLESYAMLAKKYPKVNDAYIQKFKELL